MKELENNMMIASKRKAFNASVTMPAVIFTVVYFAEASYSLVAVAVWIAFVSFVYKTTQKKQLTAYYFFNNLKIEFLLLSPFIALISIALYIGHFS